ncbi:MAG: uroporphyrinogen-III C-methyltransferase [Clostridiales bacterium]|nr:uroporphyrinogen-III C-methyltransferase [Clostridiales bacterium]
MRVTLVGAGPGEKGLLTLKGAQRIKNADAVLYDRFVGDEIVAMIPSRAEKIDVGKNAGNHPVPQDEINRLLLEKARQGLDVVRLKGGDPFVFGRGGEELELLAENGIPFEVVPGVTSAIAGAAYAGIPVTHRDFASSVQIITGHAKNNETLAIDYDAVVRAGGTLVFVMGVENVRNICAGCIAAGMEDGMPAAIVENATAGSQRKFLGTVGTLPAIAKENSLTSPALIIIGKVCLLSERYDWFSKKPLLGKHVVSVRAKRGANDLSAALRELGCCVHELCGSIKPLTEPGCPLGKALRQIDEYSWLVFTSSAGADVFFNYLIGAGIDIRALHHLKIACVGAETGKSIKKRGINVDYSPDVYNGASLARGLAALVKNGERLLIARAKDGAKELTEILKGAGAAFDDVAVYETQSGFLHGGEAAAIINAKADFVALTSPSAAKMFAQAAGCMDFSTVKAVCIGEKTAAAARALGMEAHVAGEATIESMVKKIEEMSK